MNKLLLSLGVVAVLAGCDKPAENRVVTPQNEMNQSAPADIATNTTTSAAAAATNTVTADTPPVSTTAPATAVEPLVPENSPAVDNSVAAQDRAMSDTTNAAPPVMSGNPDRVATERQATLNNASKVDVIDASSEDAMTASLDRMIAHLSDSEKEAFAEAFLIYAMSKVDMSLDEETNQRNMLAALNGKSVNDIMTAADKIRTNANTERAVTPPAKQQ